MMKDRKDLVLLALASAAGRPLGPVQLQKAVFLLQEKLPKTKLPKKRYKFIPDNYGPFCGDVYDDARRLAAFGRAEVNFIQDKDFVQYSVTPKGLAEAEELLEQFPQQVRDFCRRLIAWVTRQSFGSLVKAIYQEYPQFKVNSIFTR
jgi:ADP-heptose:LPS heptosyltransferase